MSTQTRRFSQWWGLPSIAVVVTALAMSAETYTPEPSDRLQINLGDTPWKFSKTDNFPAAKEVAFDDNSWQSVGVPHSYNDMDTYTNSTGGTQGTVYTTAWYRKHFTLNSTWAGRKIFVEFQGINQGAAVYINGVFKAGNSAVAQPGQVTHVGGGLPFVVDITNDVQFGKENVLAVRVSNSRSNSFFAWPGIGDWDCMNMGGLVRPVYLHVANKVYVPINVYSVANKWGTYVATTSASSASATVVVQTNVYNDDSQNKNISLVTRIVDAQNTVVATLTNSQTVNAGGSHIFSQTATVPNPHLWYPNMCPAGSPYLYKVYHIVKVDNQTVDVFTSPLGIRVITWDGHFAYFNGVKHQLWGFGQRYEYPALGGAIPEEQIWRDIKLMADAGGRLNRPGHYPAAPATIAACDAYGVCVLENSTDGEWSLNGSEPRTTYKKEFHRDCMVRDRNHPSILAWEINNGFSSASNQPYVNLVHQWDSLAPRASGTRDNSDIWTSEILLGSTCGFGTHAGIPSAQWEAYCANSSARFAWNYEKQFASSYIGQWQRDGVNANSYGWVHWMFNETYAEAYKSYMEGMSGSEKSLGSCATDQNRIPKLIYRIWKNALWVPYSIKPGVALQSHWNYGAGNQTVNTWSNCPSVELFVNGVSKGNGSFNASENGFSWTVPWVSGTIKAVGRDATGKEVCSDQRTTAGTPHHIVLNVEPALVKPDGTAFAIHANGSDAAFVLATIVDSAGNWCPLANQNITFSVSGQGIYRGSSNFYATAGQPTAYHAPGSPELQAEGGMMKVAVRSTFAPGQVTVTATSSGLGSGTATFTTVPVVDVTGVVDRSPHLAGFFVRAISNSTMQLQGNTLAIPAGKYSFCLMDVAGKLVFGESGIGPARRDLSFVRPGVYMLLSAGKTPAMIQRIVGRQ